MLTVRQPPFVLPYTWGFCRFKIMDELVCVEISESERIDLENKIFNGYRYTRKRAAYQARSQYKSPLDKEEWERMLIFFNFVCCNCEGEVIGGRPTKDHIIPIIFGGTNHIKNLQPLCRECNVSNVDMMDYRLQYCEKHGIDLPTNWI